MKITAEKFLSQSKKAITLMGMSGVGKSYISSHLEEWGWKNYSVDYLIGAEYLKEHLGGGAYGMSADNIAGLSEFVGQVGDVQCGGLPLAEFQKRQKMYYEAEVQAVADACGVIDGADGGVVVDSSGSLCEIENEAVLQALGERSVFVYLKVRQEGHGEILSRAVEYPKPLYFPPAFLLERLEYYKAQFDVEDIAQIDPVEFLRWVFPFLFEARLAKYQTLADKYGVTIYSDQFAALESEEQFLDVVARALDEQS